MKYIAIALTLALSQATASSPSLRQVDHKDTVDRELDEVIELEINKHPVVCSGLECTECALPFAFSLANAGCDCDIDKEQFEQILDQLKQKLSDNACKTNDPRKFLIKIFGLESTATDAKIIKYLEKLCEEAHEKQLSAATPFGDITDEGNLFDKEYYDGGTYYNEERETESFPGSPGSPDYELDVDPGTTIKDFYDNEAQSWNVQYPSYMTNFRNCKYNTAMCCFVQDRQAEDNNGNCDTPYDVNCRDADPADNTDICYVNMTESKRSNHVNNGFAIYANDDAKGEGAAHCHGFAWADDSIHPSSMYRGNNLFYISMVRSFVDNQFSVNYTRTKSLLAIYSFQFSTTTFTKGGMYAMSPGLPCAPASNRPLLFQGPIAPRLSV